MPSRNSYFPARIGDQIRWVRNFRNKIGAYETACGYSPGEIGRVQADCDRVLYLVETVQTATQAFAQAVTAHLELVQNGAGPELVPLPIFTLPATPPPPANVLPGALKRVFAFVANLKTRPGYTADIGEDLQVEAGVEAEDRDATPPCAAEVRGGEVIVTFKKLRRLGVWIEGQVGGETEWSFLAIDTTSPYNDTRPLKVAGQPERRRYRLCFWDGEPTRVWGAVLEVVYGGQG